MVTLGRWSYGLFVWHLAALAMVFPVIGEFAFNGHMPVVLVLTVVFGFAIAAVSYALVESPCRKALAALGETANRTAAVRTAAATESRSADAAGACRRAMTSSRTADRRALPASSRSGVSLNSTVRGSL